MKIEIGELRLFRTYSKTDSDTNQVEIEGEEKESINQIYIRIYSKLSERIHFNYKEFKDMKIS